MASHVVAWLRPPIVVGTLEAGLVDRDRHTGSAGRGGADGAAAPAERRGGVLSALYLLAYLAMGSTALLLGAVATAHGLGVAVDLGAVFIGALSLLTLLATASL
jgi:hypothetical protein